MLLAAKNLSSRFMCSGVSHSIAPSVTGLNGFQWSENDFVCWRCLSLESDSTDFTKGIPCFNAFIGESYQNHCCCWCCCCWHCGLWFLRWSWCLIFLPVGVLSPATGGGPLSFFVLSLLVLGVDELEEQEAFRLPPFVSSFG